jgi:hypothetical protein
MSDLVFTEAIGPYEICERPAWRMTFKDKYGVYRGDRGVYSCGQLRDARKWCRDMIKQNRLNGE